MAHLTGSRYRLVAGLGVALVASGGIHAAVAQAVLNAPLKANGHCSLMQSNPSDNTVGCLVWDQRPFGESEARQIEIYRGGELRTTIEPGDPIREWHFWKGGREMSVAFGALGAPEKHALYELASGRQVDAAVAGGSLPPWAMSRSQLEDESVPEGARERQERTLWMAKVLRSLGGVKAGMRRRDLAPWVTGEGGVSFRTERTYVSVECPYIKMDLKFKAVGDGTAESAEDVVVEVSKAYLGWSVMD